MSLLKSLFSSIYTFQLYVHIYKPQLNNISLPKSVFFNKYMSFIECVYLLYIYIYIYIYACIILGLVLLI